MNHRIEIFFMSHETGVTTGTLSSWWSAYGVAQRPEAFVPMFGRIIVVGWLS
jgi:hypothetical protein